MTIPRLVNIIRLSQTAMLLALILFLLSIAISYPYAEHFSIAVQVTAHIATIVLAGIFKVAAVAVMAANKELYQLSQYQYAGKSSC